MERTGLRTEWDRTQTSRVRAQRLTDGFGVDADASNACNEIATVAFEKDAVFCPVVVFIVFFPGTLEEGIVLCFWA